MQLDPLIKPKSVAILGASANISVGHDIIETLERYEFSGGIYPINPKYPSIRDVPCYPSLTDLPEAPDIVAFCVGAGRIMENFRLLPEVGAKAAVIFGGGYAEQGEDGVKVQQEIISICQENGIALLGPNCMGLINPSAGSATYLQLVRDKVALAGNVGLISQSGSVCISMLSDTRRFGYSLVASTGNEAVVTTADFLDYMVDHAETKVIATFTESVADPERYVAALDRAADKGKPVVVLKVGKIERTRHAITSHTGGLAGDARVFSEVLRAHRAIEVDDIDELAEVLAVCQGKRWSEGRRMGVVTSSGGMAELILDLAESNDLELPTLPADDLAEVERIVGPVSGDGNPLDAWGNGDFNTNIPHALKVVRESPSNDVVVMSNDNNDDNPMGRPSTLLSRAEILYQSAVASDKPHYQMTMRPSLLIRDQTSLLADIGVPVLYGVRQGLRAIDRMSRWMAGAGTPKSPTRRIEVAELTEYEFANRNTVNEFDAKRLMARMGLRITRERLAATLDDAIAAADALGYPVVMKVCSDDIPHKSEHGLVLVGLANADEIRHGWEDLQGKLATQNLAAGDTGILVQEMVRGGIEVFAGVAHHAGFGHALAFGMGGVDIEVLRDFTLRMLPLRDGDAEQMIGEIRGAPLLGANRGRPAADVASLAECLYALSGFIESAGPMIAEIDLNPIVVLPEGQGCVIVDALIAPSHT
jgi:acetate---CoA ligase (ADP-forming)